jgi:hypothetical protein
VGNGELLYTGGVTIDATHLGQALNKMLIDFSSGNLHRGEAL